MISTQDPPAPSGGSALLAQYCPVVQYDSQERYFTDSAAILTEAPGTTLRRADGESILAPVSLAKLGRNYPNGQAALATDYLQRPNDATDLDAALMHQTAGYANVAHGRVDQIGAQTWLQYWFFMYYDSQLNLGLATHQGDLEMIQLLLVNGAPVLADYAQHRSGVTAPWGQVERDGDHPVVYSARGSHASMMRWGLLVSTRSFLPDLNDNGGARVSLRLIELTDAATPWINWPGSWGDTKPGDSELGKLGVEAYSPHGFSSHLAWRNPPKFHLQCAADDDLPALGAPHVFSGA